MRRIGWLVVILGAVVVAGCWPLGSTTIRIGGSDAGGATPAETHLPVVTPSSDPWQTGEIVFVQLVPPAGAALTDEQHAAAERVVRDRLAALGTPGTSVRAIPDGRLRIDVADATWADAVRRVAAARGGLTFVAIPAAYASVITNGEPLPADMPIEVIVDAGRVLGAHLTTDQLGGPAVDIQLDTTGADALDAWAAQHVGERMAMVLDGIVLTAPVINATDFDGRAQISGGVDLQAMTELAAILAGGVLPVRAEVLWLCPADDAAPACPSLDPAGG